MKDSNPLAKNTLVKELISHKDKWVTLKMKSDGSKRNLLVKEITDDGYVKCSVQVDKDDDTVYVRVIPINRIEYVEVETELVWIDEEEVSDEDTK